MDKLTIVINSTKTYAHITLPPLIEMIKKFNPGFRVLVVIGNHDIKRVASVEDYITYVESDNNSLDYTGIITILEEPQILLTEWFLYLHDTIELGPTFFNRLLNCYLPEYNPENSKNITSVSFRFPSANLGIYNINCIKRLKPAILQLKNKDNSILQELKSLSIVVEDGIFRMNMQEHRFFMTPPEPKWDEPTVDKYNTGVKRLKEYYPDLDLWKFKASFALSYTYTMSP